MTIHLTARELRKRGFNIPDLNVRVTARADTRKPGKYYPFRTKTEMVFATHCVMLVKQMLGKEVVEIRYEPIIFILLGEKYKIDFLLICADGETMFVECKWSKKAFNYRDARSKLQAAATLHYYWTFVLACWPDHRAGELAWTLEVVKVEEFK